jgi:hypothetical protein
VTKQDFCLQFINNLFIVGLFKLEIVELLTTIGGRLDCKAFGYEVYALWLAQYRQTSKFPLTLKESSQYYQSILLFCPLQTIDNC